LFLCFVCFYFNSLLCTAYLLSWCADIWSFSVPFSLSVYNWPGGRSKKTLCTFPSEEDFRSLAYHGQGGDDQFSEQA
jgi:hypothetical protein